MSQIAVDNSISATQSKKTKLIPIVKTIFGIVKVFPVKCEACGKEFYCHPEETISCPKCARMYHFRETGFGSWFADRWLTIQLTDEEKKSFLEQINVIEFFTARLNNSHLMDEISKQVN